MFSIKVLTERELETPKKLFLCFVDYDLRLMRDLYLKQNATVRVGVETSMSQEIKRGVRQGWVVSPELFNLYSEIIEILQTWKVLSLVEGI